MDSGLWTLDSGLWTLDSGLWTLDSGPWTLDRGPAPLLFDRNADHIQPQHLTVERLLRHAFDDLHAIGPAGLSVIHLPIVPVHHAHGHRGARGHWNSGLEVFLVNQMANLRVMVQPVRLLRIGHLDVPRRPVARPNGAAGFVEWIHFDRRFAVPNGGGLEESAHAQPDVINDPGLATDHDCLFDELLVDAGVRLRRVFASARI